MDLMTHFEMKLRYILACSGKSFGPACREYLSEALMEALDQIEEKRNGWIQRPQRR